MTKHKRVFVAIGLACAITVAAEAQILSTPPVVGGVVDRLGSIGSTTRELSQQASTSLADLRRNKIADLVRANPSTIALDPEGFPARSGEVLLDNPDTAVIGAAITDGFRLIEQGEVLSIPFARIATPPGRSLAWAIRTLKRLGAKSVSADQLHIKSGIVETAASVRPGNAGPAIGIIDAGVSGAVTARRGFATGAPVPSNHGSAIASLITGAGSIRGALPSARLYAADVYGTDPAGGNASAIAKALAWLVGERVPVVTISLVGPANPLLGRVIAVAQARGTIIVAAVGNDGPASPPSYPASYPGVIAVTGIDGRDRVLIEAGRATHLDYAAPGADMLAANASGTGVPVRGTSFAAPLVAAKIASAYQGSSASSRTTALARVDAEARKAGSRYGRGIVCEQCRTPTK